MVPQTHLQHNDFLSTLLFALFVMSIQDQLASFLTTYRGRYQAQRPKNQRYANALENSDLGTLKKKTPIWVLFGFGSL